LTRNLQSILQIVQAKFQLSILIFLYQFWVHCFGFLMNFFGWSRSSFLVVQVMAMTGLC